MGTSKSEFQQFDTAVSKILSVSHAELQRREGKWKKMRMAKRKTNAEKHRPEPRKSQAR